MAALDYYSVLNLSPADTSAAIEAAFRDYTRMFDHGIGLWPKDHVQRRMEAFSELLDHVRRRSYDGRRTHDSAVPIDLAPQPAMAASSIFSGEVRPSAAALRERLLRNFTRIGIPKAEHPESLTVEMHVRPEDRLRGSVAIELPVYEPCPHCGGAGHVDFTRCGACGAAGFIESIGVLHEQVGAAVVERSLENLGIENCYLRLLFVID